MGSRADRAAPKNDARKPQVLAGNRIMGDGKHTLISDSETDCACVAPPGASLRAFSERQALDWGLVMASQEIEAMITHDPLEGIWHVEIPPAELKRARATIVRYRAENRYRFRQRQLAALPGKPVFLHWAAGVWALALAVIHGLAQVAFPGWKTAGTLDSTAFAAGEWWRCITAVTLHSGMAHLASNVATGLLVLGLAMSQLGAGILLFLSLTSAVMANVGGWVLRQEPYIGLGASGMVLAALGLLCGMGLSNPPAHQSLMRARMLAIYGGIGLFVMLGASTEPGVDWLVHVLGFLFGAGFGWLAGKAGLGQKSARTANIYAGMLAVAMVVSAWSVAIPWRR